MEMKKGFLYFRKGALYDDVFAKLKGEQAVHEGISLKNFEISFKEFPEIKLRRRIKTGLMSSVMEGAIRKGRPVALEMDPIEPAHVSDSIEGELVLEAESGPQEQVETFVTKNEKKTSEKTK